MNEHTYDAYFGALALWKIEYVEKAALQMIRTSTFFPLPKDFLAELTGMAWNDEIFKEMREPILALPEKVREVTQKIGGLAKPHKETTC